MAQTEVLHAYRHLYRAGLRAVCRSQPASTAVRNLLRQSFRAKDARLDARAVKRTVWFLNYAAKELGVEHKVVKNMLMVKYWKDRVAKDKQLTWTQVVQGNRKVKPTAVEGSEYVHYGKTIEMLNKTMGLCLPLP